MFSGIITICGFIFILLIILQIVLVVRYNEGFVTFKIPSKGSSSDDSGTDDTAEEGGAEEEGGDNTEGAEETALISSLYNPGFSAGKMKAKFSGSIVDEARFNS